MASQRRELIPKTTRGNAERVSTRGKNEDAPRVGWTATTLVNLCITPAAPAIAGRRRLVDLRGLVEPVNTIRFPSPDSPSAAGGLAAGARVGPISDVEAEQAAFEAEAALALARANARRRDFGA